jgi:hypothetical protein
MHSTPTAANAKSAKPTQAAVCVSAAVRGNDISNTIVQIVHLDMKKILLLAFFALIGSSVFCQKLSYTDCLNIIQFRLDDAKKTITKKGYIFESDEAYEGGRLYIYSWGKKSQTNKATYWGNLYYLPNRIVFKWTVLEEYYDEMFEKIKIPSNGWKFKEEYIGSDGWRHYVYTKGKIDITFSEGEEAKDDMAYEIQFRRYFN